MYFGKFCQTAAMPSLAQGPPVGVHPSTDLKPLLPFSRFPGFRESEASFHCCGTKHTKRLGDPVPPDTGASDPNTKESQTGSVSPCLAQPHSEPGFTDVTAGPVSSPSSASGGAPLACSPAVSMETHRDPCLSPGSTADKEKEMKEAVEEFGESEEEKAKRLLYCSLCKVAVNSASQLQAHNSGTKHKTMLEARSGDGVIKSFPRSGVKARLAPPTDVSTGLQNKTFHCEICDVHVNSETQLKQHIGSRRHKDRAAGKPAKPKFSPYSQSPPYNHNPQTVGIPLRKEQDLGKPIGSCLLQRHLSFAAAAAMASMAPFHVRPSPTTWPLPQIMLHPAPGPLRTAHTPVLFSPY